MAFPITFATLPTGNVPAADLDTNFAVAFLTTGNNTVTGTTTLSPPSGDALILTAGAIETSASTIASAATVGLGTSASNYVIVTGTTTITSFGASVQAGAFRIVKFSGALTLTNGANLLCPGGANLPIAAGQAVLAVDEGSNVWRVFVLFQPGSSTSGTVTAGTSNTLAFSSSGSNTQAHGLGAAPAWVSAWLQCTTTNIGYSVGDRIALASIMAPVSSLATAGSGSVAADQTIIVEYDATNTKIIMNSTVSGVSSHFFLPQKSTGVFTQALDSSWEVVAIPYKVN